MEIKSSEQASTNNQTEHLVNSVAEAIAKKQPLSIRAGGSKDFLGNPSTTPALDVSTHTGIVSYEPTELVVTARSGTTLNSLNKTLSENGQMLAFEPPVYAAEATLGGTVACALSGPGTPYYGATRDFVLGCRIINGQAQTLRFGGEVMKNVAGYDITRLMTGAMGTLGILLDISLKVLPRPEAEITLEKNSTAANAIVEMQKLAGLSEPVTASAFIGDTMHIRLSGTHSAITASAQRLGGDVSPSTEVWSKLRDHQLEFFNNHRPLWRISLPPLTPELKLSGECLYDWAGMQRWLFSDEDPQSIRSAASNAGGHATLFRAADNLRSNAGAFQSPSAEVLALNKKIKHEFDPKGIFNPQRMYHDV